MRGTGQSAFTCAKLHIKARKTLDEPQKRVPRVKVFTQVKSYCKKLHFFLPKRKREVQLTKQRKQKSWFILPRFPSTTPLPFAMEE